MRRRYHSFIEGRIFVQESAQPTSHLTTLSRYGKQLQFSPWLSLSASSKLLRSVKTSCWLCADAAHCRNTKHSCSFLRRRSWMAFRLQVDQKTVNFTLDGTLGASFVNARALACLRLSRSPHRRHGNRRTHSLSSPGDVRSRITASSVSSGSPLKPVIKIRRRVLARQPSGHVMFGCVVASGRAADCISPKTCSPVKTSLKNTSSLERSWLHVREYTSSFRA